MNTRTQEEMCYIEYTCPLNIFVLSMPILANFNVDLLYKNS
jgi:hypothetical protein